MKIGGVVVSGPAEEILVLPRPMAQDIVIRAKAVMDTSDFDRLVPEPKPKAQMVKGGKWEERLDDPDYVAALAKHGELRFAYMVLKSLEPSEIEWETVNMGKPSTWTNWQEEMRSAGFSQTELNRIVACVAAANALDESKLQAARDSFLRGLAKASEELSGRDIAPETMPSGELANDSVSDHQE